MESRRQETSATRCSPEMERTIREKQRQFRDKFIKRLHYRERLPCICQSQTDADYANDAEMNTLRKVIGNMLFGIPKGEAQKENNFTGFDTDQMKTIDKVYTSLMSSKLSGDNGVEVAIILISLIGDSTECEDVPVFRVEVSRDTSNFVDLSSRWYKDFDDFVSNNKFRAAKYYIPEGGVYSLENGEVKLASYLTPAAKVGRRILRGTDIAASALGMAAAVGLFCPPAAIACGVLAGATSGYGVVRASCRLADMGKHKQSLGSVTAAQHWIALTGSVLGFACSGAVVAAKLADEGKVIFQLAPELVNGLRCATGIAGVVMSAGALPRIVLNINDEDNSFQMFQAMAGIMLISLCFETGISKENLEALARKYKPYVISKIDSFLNRGFSSLEEMFTNLCEMLSGFKNYGPRLFSAFKIVATFFKIRDVKGAKKCLNELKDFLHLSHAAKRHTSSSSTDAQIMILIVNDENLIFKLLSCFYSEEHRFHFHCGHCSWSSNGELSSEEYILIAQNALKKTRGAHDLTRDSLSLGQVDNVRNHFLVNDIGFISITLHVDQKMLEVKIIDPKELAVCPVAN